MFLDFVINNVYTQKLEDFCSDFIYNNQIGYSLEQLLTEFEKASPSIDEKKLAVKLNINHKEMVYDPKILVRSKDSKVPIRGADVVKKTRKQIIYLGKKTKKYSVEERQAKYKEVFMFCNYLRQLRLIRELDFENNEINSIDEFVSDLMSKGF